MQQPGGNTGGGEGSCVCVCVHVCGMIIMKKEK